MRTTCRFALLTALALASQWGCGGGRSAASRNAAGALADLEADTARLPGGSTVSALAGDGAVGQKGLQLYVVLLPDASAFQGPEAQKAMWRAVRGEDPKFEGIARQVRLTGDYPLEIALDFADLPHPQVSMSRIGRMLDELPPALAAQGKSSALAVFVQSRAPVLAGGGHVRMVGSAPLFIAERWGGLIVDLIGRRAWTPEAWRAELEASALSPKQVKLIDQRDPEGGRWLLTRGLSKFAVADVQIRKIDPERLVEARKRILEAQETALSGGALTGGRPCDAPKGFHDGPCVQLGNLE
ncbi:MAG: hypothetical protein ACE366_24430 [Bradymonadia bacterium]